MLAIIISSLGHAFSSVFLFMYNGLLVNRVYSRYYECSFFFDQMMRSLLVIGILTNVGFAMTLNFVGEIFGLIGLFSMDSL